VSLFEKFTAFRMTQKASSSASRNSNKMYYVRVTIESVCGYGERCKLLPVRQYVPVRLVLFGSSTMKTKAL